MITPRTHGDGRSTGRRLVPAMGLVLAAALAFPAVAGANLKLWLYPEGAGPRQGGHVLNDGNFTLVVENVGGGSGDSTAYDVALVVALNDPALLGSGTVTLPGGEVVDLTTSEQQLGIPSMPCSGKTIPPHGVYPSTYLTIDLGDLAEGGIWQIPVDVSGEAHLAVHFDAVAKGFKETGHGTVCYDVVNPSGHDVTLTFEEPVEPSCPDVAITKSAPTTGVALDDEVQYTIEVANEGGCDLTEVVITEDIPTVDDGAGGTVPAFTVVATDPAPSSQDEASLAWALGAPLAPGAVTAVTVTAAFDEPLADGQEVVNTACVASAEMEEPECDAAEVAVGVAPAATSDVTGPGFWCNRIRLALEERPGATYTLAELEELLALVDAESTVFSEHVDAGTAELAQPLLCTPGDVPMADKLARQLLALWLNVVSGRLDRTVKLADLCAGEEALPPGSDPDLTVEGVIAAAEGALTSSEPSHAALVTSMQLVDFINNASTDEECAAGEGAASDTLQAPRRAHGRRKAPR